MNQLARSHLAPRGGNADSGWLHRLVVDRQLLPLSRLTLTRLPKGYSTSLPRRSALIISSKPAFRILTASRRDRPRSRNLPTRYARPRFFGLSSIDNLPSQRYSTISF